jgi:hypothetical protein
MLKFNEVNDGYEADENVELLRVAESTNGDLMTLVKLKDQEQYQLSVTLSSGNEAFDTYYDYEFANNMFDNILAIKEEVE